MRLRFWLLTILIAGLFTLSGCEAVDFGNGIAAAPVAQPAVSIAQRQRSILTPVGQDDDSSTSAEEQPAEQVEPSPTILSTDEGIESTEENQQESLTITNPPTLIPTSTATATVEIPSATSTQAPATATVEPQPTNTRVPPTATFTATTAVEPTSVPTATNDPSGGGEPTSCNPGGNSSFETQLINLINEERANGGLPALSKQSQLTSAARTHSDDMACNNFFSHTSPTTGSPFDRIAAAGYSFSWAGENIAAGYGSPAAVIEGWMSSDGHRANILNENFTQIGIGYAYWGDSDYGAYWTAVFASP